MVNYAEGMDVMRNPGDQVDYDALSEGVRRFATERLYELEKGLRPLVDGTFGEVLPGHLTAYLGLLRELGRLYQLSKPPRELQNLVPMDKVTELVAGIRAEHARELAAAVREAEERARIQVAEGTQVSIQQAQATVLTKLLELEGRGA